MLLNPYLGVSDGNPVRVWWGMSRRTSNVGKKANKDPYQGEKCLVF